MRARTPLDLKTLHSLCECPTQEALSDAIDRVVKRLGVDFWFYAVDLPLVTDGPNQVRMGTYPEEWVNHYFDVDYIGVDPIISHCHDHSTPLAWRDALVARRRVIDPQLLKDDPEMLEDLVAAAVNDAVNKVGEMSSSRMAKVTGGMNLPPGFKLPFG